MLRQILIILASVAAALHAANFGGGGGPFDVSMPDDEGPREPGLFVSVDQTAITSASTERANRAEGSLPFCSNNARAASARLPASTVRPPNRRTCACSRSVSP